MRSYISRSASFNGANASGNTRSIVRSIALRLRLRLFFVPRPSRARVRRADADRSIEPFHPATVASGVVSPDPRVPGTHTRMSDPSCFIHVRARSSRTARACAPIIDAAVCASYFRVVKTEPGGDRDDLSRSSAVTTRTGVFSVFALDRGRLEARRARRRLDARCDVDDAVSREWWW